MGWSLRRQSCNHGIRIIEIQCTMMWVGPVGTENIMLITFQDPFDDSDPDEPTYFTSTAPSTLSFSGSPSRSRRRLVSDRSYSTSPSPPQTRPSPPPPHQLVLRKPDSILEVISQEWAKESGWGVWKASNTTFVYNLLLETLEKWSRGVLSALLNVPDPGLGLTVELAGSQYPWVSLGVAVAAAAVAGVLLAPLDLIRTKWVMFSITRVLPQLTIHARFIILPTSASKRSLTTQLRTLTSYLCPTPLILPTLLHSLVTPTISHSTPLLLRSYLSIDPVLTPGMYQMMRLFSRAAELVVKLPLETVLRRGQMAVLKEEAELTRGEGVWAGDMETVVNIGDYNGVFGTMWSIVREEGVREPPPATGKNAKSKTPGKPLKGQGLPGLWRGWRVGMWGLVGIWTSKQLGGGANGGEF